MIERLLARVSSGAPSSLRGRSDVCVAFSGGLDSSVLLDVLCRLRSRIGLRVSAMHVHHGLSPHADTWATHCEKFAAQRGVDCQVERVTVARRSHRGLEAEAREARYGALGASGASVVALAHHRDDQAETVLLQAARGSGLAGLAAMPTARERAGVLWWRPLIDEPREALQDYAAAAGLEWVEDESNARCDVARNVLRLQVLPALKAPFPQARESLAALAAHAATAARVLDEIAEEDLARLWRDGGIDAVRLGALTPDRQAGVLRAALRAQGLPMPSRARLEGMRSQLLESRADAQPCVSHARWRWRRHGGVLLLAPGSAAPALPWSCPWRGGDDVDLGPGRGRVLFRESASGIDPQRIGHGDWVFASRRGGERLRPRAGGPSRTLKNLLREAGIPAHVRTSLPLLFLDGHLVWAPGVGVCADRMASPGWMPVWEPPGRRRDA